MKSSGFLDKALKGKITRQKPVRSAKVVSASESSNPNEDSQEPLDLYVSNMCPEEVLQNFERMLDDMNLSEEKKGPLRIQDLDKKRNMLAIHMKGSSQKNGLNTASEYITYLSQPDLSCHKTLQCVTSLRIALTNNPVSFLTDFGQQGLCQLLSVFNSGHHAQPSGPLGQQGTTSSSGTQVTTWQRVQLECVRALRSVMSCNAGVKLVLGHAEVLTCMLARALDPVHASIMLEAVRILSVLSLLSSSALERTLEALTVSAELKGLERRFEPLVQGLADPSNDLLKVAIMIFFNTLLTSAEDLDFRIHLRNEIMRTGLYELLEVLECDSSEDLHTQLNVFNTLKDDDHYEYCQRFDLAKLEMDDLDQCYEVLKNFVFNTPCEPYFLSVLQHLLFIRDEPFVKVAYYKLIEECVTQIVLHKSGLDPDISCARRFRLDLEPLIDTLIERGRQEEEAKVVDQLNKRLDEMLVVKQENEARIASYERRIKELEQKSSPSLVETHGNNLARVLAQHNGQSSPPQAPILPAIRPPQLPSTKAPPLPPALPSGTAKTIAPPLLPGAPRLPGLLGAPGLPPLASMKPPPQEIKLPYGMKPKRKWSHKNKIRRVNWKKIIPSNLKENSFWVKVNEEKYLDTEIFENLDKRFAVEATKKSSECDGVVSKSRKIKELKVLDSRAAQNLSILLGGPCKHMSYEDICRAVLACDDTVLSESLVESLVQFCPTPDQLKRLEAHRDIYDQLCEAEQFALTVSFIKRIVPRLKSILFKLRYNETVTDIKPNIVASIAACEEVLSSKKLLRLLELILLLGNYMNSGCNNEQSVGFEISFISKLKQTKDIENKSTLLHFLVGSVESKHPELLNFADELSHVIRASKVSSDSISKQICHMDMMIKSLETDLRNNRVPISDDDKFSSIMTPFCITAREQVDILKEMNSKFSDLFTKIADFFAFSKQKYPVEEFFSDLSSFIIDFKEALSDNINEREKKEKLERANEARRKAEQDRKAALTKKQALQDMINGADDQEGVMDSLLEALKTGQAYTREKTRRRVPRAAGAERRAQLNRSRSRNALVLSPGNNREVNGGVGDRVPGSRRPQAEHVAHTSASADELESTASLMQRVYKLDT